MSLCKNPYMAGALAHGCGQCLPCRINLGRMWKWRQFLESTQHENNCFITLTYDDKSINGNWALDPRHLQLFIKRFRMALRGVPIRYYAVGEYGDTSRRPHYHLSVFGVSGYSSIDGNPIAVKKFARGLERVVDGIVHQCWGMGGVDVQEFNHVTAVYVAGYTTKKLTDYKHGRIWNYPERSWISNRPGLGVGAMEHLAKIILSHYTNWETGDVPTIIKCGKDHIPLGRYLISCLRKAVGFRDGMVLKADENGKNYWSYDETADYIRLCKQRLTDQKVVEMQALFNLSELGTFKGAYIKDVEGQMNQVEARAKRMAIAKLSRKGKL